MKTKNIIQRLCLFLFVLMLALPAVATNYGREGYKVFRSRELGKHQTVRTLRKGNVEITFSSCTTSGSSGNGAIYQPAKGSRITVKADDGYSIRWIILRDTEGGKSYRDKDGIKRISSVTSGYNYYFEKEAVSNSYISGANQNNLNDDDNNIVVYQYDASAQSVEIRAHNNRNWDQFKVRDIIVGYVRAPKVRFEKDRYDMYYMPIFHPQSNSDDHSGNREYKVDNHDIATVNASGTLKFKRPGTVVLTTTFSASKNCAKAQCSTTVNMMRDRVTFTAEGLPDVIFSNDSYNLREYLKRKAQSGRDFDQYNSGFSVTSSNPAVLRYDDRWLKFGGTAGEATITLKQEQNNYYEATTFSHTIIVARRDQDGTILIKDANEWKVFCKLVNEKGMTNLNAKLEADVNLGSEINMVGNVSSKDYGGTFDGQNHTLKLDWSNTNGLLAPFWCVKDATIKNLRTEGNIKSSYSLLSGLILTVYGKTTITNCVSAVNITSTYNGSGCIIAGMILEIPYGAVVTFTDCIVKGKYNTTLKEGSISVSGFISNHNGTSTFNNCIYLGDNIPGGGYTFAAYTYLGPTLNNYYYLNACGIAQGTKITAEQLKNGEVTKKLQNNRTDKCYWAQQLGEMPDFYNAADKSKANYVYYDAAKKGWTCDDFRLTDGQPLPIGLDFTAANVTYERNFNGAQKATLCLPYDLYAQGFKAYTLSGGNKNEVHFKEVDDKLTAYTPYYITANGMPQLGGRNIEVKAYKADKMTTLAAGYKFTGTVAGVSNATAAAANAYILQDDGKFHKVTTANSAATIPAYRAYIICPPQASGAKQLSVVLDGETTGIGSTTNEATDGKNGPVYDLQGRRVADRLDDARHRLPAGVYIVGGRKVVVK
ncbi:hypothetical protein [Prevotella denticola]|uniref:hypothetical protein n=1 Tax=Prevotella denticola TaxID=28129 RepID=UPI000201284B|nr:hypothetical protein [Prevotella denticola]AEA20596.1 hypothetical protein HMPREF9137_2158 [Prevotella denticola F0289]QUB89276.1 hypothetical protein J4860_10540 [Prevotella denticola]